MEKLHFFNPEYLWGLLFLLIPIIIHLFNFRKAKIIFFTRVDLLSEIKTEKRYFSTLKKRLILLTRLSAILFFVLATASPYLSNTNLDKSSKATFLYLDNSFSMQAKLGNQTLLDVAKKKVLKSFRHFKGTSQIYLLDNWENTEINSENELMLELSKIGFSYQSFSTIKAKSRIKNIAEENSISDYNSIVFSDFNETTVEEDSLFSNFKIAKIRIENDAVNNVSVDSLWIETVNVAESKFTVSYKLSSVAKRGVEFSESVKFDDKIQQSLTRKIESESDTVLNIKLSIPKNKKASGVISIQDGDIGYDNNLFFSVDFNRKSKVLFVGDRSSKRLDYILNDEFVSLENVSYSSFGVKNLDKIDFLIYSINHFSNDDLNKLKEYLSKDKEVLLIPNSKVELKTYNRFLSGLSIGNVIGYNSKKIAVTEINYNNLFFADIFNTEVNNFEYPIVEGSFTIVEAPNSDKLLSLEDGKPFLVKSKNTYLFSSSILEGSEPFVNNDLAFPVLYKMATSKLQSNLYQFVGEYSIVDIEGVGDISLSVDGENIDLPKVSFNSYELPSISKAGNFDLYSGDKLEAKVGFNYNRSESKLREYTVNSTVESHNYEVLKNQNNIIYFWKWCITFTLVFLIIEMLLITFLKEKSLKRSE